MRLIDIDAFWNYVRSHKINFGKYQHDLLNKQPTVQAVPQWIPVSERLPEEFTNVIVTDNETSNTYQSQYIGKGYWDCDNGYFRNRIVAWMPLPEPYKAERESDED